MHEQVTGQEPVSGKRVIMNGNINALLLWNNAGQGILGRYVR